MKKDNLIDGNFQVHKINELEPLSFKQAKEEAFVLLDSVSKFKTKSVVNIFDFKDGYQVDLISPIDEFEVYSDYYKGSDVKAQVHWNQKNKKEKTLNIMK